ncbi:hypothetical protein B0H14DRAFT_3515301 [Mycena olivaceomarginata]|nr:hypothetical protein B0H14DRAFT_3515301 [Mycena olivaceomarginata]
MSGVGWEPLFLSGWGGEQGAVVGCLDLGGRRAWCEVEDGTTASDNKMGSTVPDSMNALGCCCPSPFRSRSSSTHSRNIHSCALWITSTSSSSQGNPHSSASLAESGERQYQRDTHPTAPIHTSPWPAHPPSPPTCRRRHFVNATGGTPDEKVDHVGLIHDNPLDLREPHLGGRLPRPNPRHRVLPLWRFGPRSFSFSPPSASASNAHLRSNSAARPTPKLHPSPTHAPGPSPSASWASHHSTGNAACACASVTRNSPSPSPFSSAANPTSSLMWCALVLRQPRRPQLGVVRDLGGPHGGVRTQRAEDVQLHVVQERLRGGHELPREHDEGGKSWSPLPARGTGSEKAPSEVSAATSVSVSVTSQNHRQRVREHTTRADTVVPHTNYQPDLSVAAAVGSRPSALVLGDLESAVSLCLTSARYADAILLAHATLLHPHSRLPSTTGHPSRTDSGHPTRPPSRR